MTERVDPLEIARARLEALEGQAKELAADTQQKRESPEFWHSQWMILQLEINDLRKELTRIPG